jgi:hypothetical protein
MSKRIPGGGVTQNPFGPQWVGQKPNAESVGEQVQSQLFGSKKPQPISSDDPLIDRLMGELHAFRKKLAGLVGDEPADYDLQLARGTIAMIDDQGLIYIGREFLMQNAQQRDVRVGVLAHEIGHRPKRWREYLKEPPVDKSQMEELCRFEETRADWFSGYALAQLGMDYEPLCRFLETVQTLPHPEYFPAELRAKTIKEAFDSGTRRSQSLKKFFPELARARGIKGDLGTG